MIFIDIAEDVETKSDTPNYKLDRLLPKGENEKLIDLMKDKSGRKIMKELAGLRA